MSEQVHQDKQDCRCSGLLRPAALPAQLTWLSSHGSAHMAPSPLPCTSAELLSQMYANADEDGRASLSKAWETGRAKLEEEKQG